MKKLINLLKTKTVELAKMLWNKLTTLLRYLRINDECNRVSLTNLAMMVMLWKIGTTDATSMTDLTALCIAILGYQAKRVIEKKN